MLKIRFVRDLRLAKIRRRFFSLRVLILYETEVSQSIQNRTPFFPNQPPILTISKTPISSHTTT